MFKHSKVYSSTVLDSGKLETIQCQSGEEWINNEMLFSNENTQLQLYPPLDESFKPQFVSKEVNHAKG